MWIYFRFCFLGAAWTGLGWSLALAGSLPDGAGVRRGARPGWDSALLGGPPWIGSGRFLLPDPDTGRFRRLASGRPGRDLGGIGAGSTSKKSRPRWALRFLAGGAIAFAAHESAHVAFDLAFGAGPGLEGVDFHGIPFFAITHHSDVSDRQRYVIASAGFNIQHLGNEWLLSRTPDLRRRPFPLEKGILAFNLLTSLGYAGAAFARTGPLQRDTRGISMGQGVDERWVGLLVLAPALLDGYRYIRPKARWARWSSRAVKLGMILLAIR